MALADGPLQVAVAGGSIGGLCAGLALQRIAGAEVDIYERHVGEVETRGAGIVGQPELSFYGSATPQSCRPRAASCGAISNRMAAREASKSCRNASPPGRRSSREIAGRGLITADLLVCAEGAQSPTRRRLLPDATSDYAGYVAWRGTLDEAVAPAELARFFDDTFPFSEARSGGHILVYYIPGASADPTRGKRRLK